MSITVTQEEYESLAQLALEGAKTPDKKRQVNVWLQSIEKRNDINRYQLWVQWQEIDSPVPRGANFPEEWPPTQRFLIQLLTRPIIKADVEEVLKKRARQPVSVLVSPDPGAVLGWMQYETYFVQG